LSEANKKERGFTLFSRRKFFSALGFGSLFLSLGGIATGALAYIFPRLNLEPSRKMALGRPQDFLPGQMKLIESAQVFVFYDKAGLQAVSAVCTHLGCSYKPFRPENVDDYGCPVYAHCPCHGSVFCRDGKNVGGPAPRPLPFYKLELSPNGRILVDKSVNELSDELSRASGEGVAHNLYLDVQSGQLVAGPYPTGEDTDFSA